MEERAQRVSDLLHEAGEVHHVVYREAGWEDYADRIIGRFS
jgi:hypothetical protein